MEFNYYLPANLIFGNGKVNEIGGIVSKLGKKVMIVTGKGSTKKTGLLYKVEDLLKSQGIEVVVFDQVEQNPLDLTAYKGAELAKENQCDVIVGLGGGSIMDCAKTISFMIHNPGDIFDYIYGKKIGTKRSALVLVPTTCGTGSEGNGFAVITNSKTLDKKSLRTTAIIPDASIIDPELMTTMPKHILASVGFDALCHLMEAYISKVTHPMIESMALTGITMVKESLVDLYKGDSDSKKWEQLSLASTLGGMCIHAALVTAPHGLEHPASGLRNIVHGRGLAALTPIIYEKSIDDAPEKFATIAKHLGGAKSTDCVTMIQKLLEEINLNTTLGKEGVLKEDVDWLTDNCMKISIGNLNNHPRVFTKEDVRKIYEMAI